MWSLYQTTSQSHSRPSTLIGISDPWAAYQLDAAVSRFGLEVENALQQMEKVGPSDKPRYQAKYTLSELLTPGFALGDGDEKKDTQKMALDSLRRIFKVNRVG